MLITGLNDQGLKIVVLYVIHHSFIQFWNWIFLGHKQLTKLSQLYFVKTSVTLSLLDFGRIKETYSIEAILFHEKLFIELQIVQELYSFTGVNENFDSK